MTHRRDFDDSQLPREPLIRKVEIRNYKSIAKCSVELGRLTVLAGRNGAGKSNFLDALRFTKESTDTALDHAIRDRGGIDAVRRRSTGHPRNFSLGLTLRLPSLDLAHYAFEIAARQRGTFVVKQEQLRISNYLGKEIAFFRREGSKVASATRENMPPVDGKRLYLTNAAGLPEFREVYESLRSMGFYNLSPDRMKELQTPDPGEILHRTGSNISSVIARLEKQHLSRVREYLATITPGITDVERITLADKETLQFRQRVAGAEHPWKFYAANMSDGTLRALGSLVAVTQLLDSEVPISFVGIEEPETALHPAAASALIDALREASQRTQVVITSHSPDLLDQLDPEKDRMLVVTAHEGATMVAPVDAASRKAITDHLFSAGDLLRMDQLGQDREDLLSQQRDLFEWAPAAR